MTVYVTSFAFSFSTHSRRQLGSRTIPCAISIFFGRTTSPLHGEFIAGDTSIVQRYYVMINNIIVNEISSFFVESQMVDPFRLILASSNDHFLVHI